MAESEGGIRRRLVIGTLLATAIISSPAVGAQPTQPNIVLILADDLGYGDVGAYGANDIFTPNIDQLATDGVRLTNFYMSPSCSLSRAMLMTGSYAPRLSMSRNHTPSAATGIHQNEITLGELLHRAGYVTALFGKWHLGDHYQYRPQRHGFDEFFGIPYSNNMWPFHPRTQETVGEDPRLTAARNRAELTGYAGRNNPFPKGEGYPNLPLLDGDTIVSFNPNQAEMNDIFIDETIAFIEDNRNRRFFAFVSLTAPHVPLHPGEEFVGTSARDLYGDTVQEIDADVGRILLRLSELGLDGQTLVIFLSDNGPWLQYGIDGGSAGGLAGGKEQQYEGGIRVPAVVRWYGELTAGTVIDEVLSGVDIFPTLARLAGADVPQDRSIDGIDVWPLLVGDTNSLARNAIYSFSEDDFSSVELGAIRSDNWKLHVDTAGSNVSATALYDLASDPGETNDLRTSQSGVVNSLESLGEAIVSDIAAMQRPLGSVSHSGDPFVEHPGIGDLISMEAENYHKRTGRGGQNWQSVSLRHSSFDASLQALPNDNVIRSSDYLQFSPHLEYRFSVENAGRFYVWVRAMGATADDDSLHVGLDGQDVGSGRWIDNIESVWTWTSRRGSERAYLDILSPGLHVLDLWMREDGVIIDKILLTTDKDFRPYGKGLVESRQSSAAPDVPPLAVDDVYRVDEGESLTGDPNVLDNDIDSTGDPMTASLVTPPSHAAKFELRPNGSFDYEHDGGASEIDSFTYVANDDDGTSNEATVTITVNTVNDPPSLALIGDEEMTLEFGAVYEEPGATASDEEDGDITDSIVVSGDTVDPGSAGTYIVTYEVTDSGGASATPLTRTVIVGNAPPPVPPAPLPPPPTISGGGGGMTLIDLLWFGLLRGIAGLLRRRKAP